MPKNYIIFYDDNNVIFPVKAEFDPYIKDRDDDDVEAYCAGEPQFFGGAAEPDEEILETLAREVDEESLLTYRLNTRGKATLFYEDRYEKPNGDAVPCEFFCTRSWVATNQAWPQQNVWNTYRAVYREMCWVATVPLATFQNLNPNQTTAYQIAQMLITAQAAGAPDWATAQMSDEPSQQFMESVVVDAFAAFVREWLGGGLP